MMDRPLRAPWRIEYIKAPKHGECIFCAAASADDDASVHVVARGERCFALLNRCPYAGAHDDRCVPSRRVTRRSTTASCWRS
jgi:ATP adenylyltransferase